MKMKNRKGATLIMTLMVLMVLSILAIAIITIASSNRKSDNMQRQYSQSYYVAKSGLDLASEYIVNNNDQFVANLNGEDDMTIPFVLNSSNGSTPGFSVPIPTAGEDTINKNVTMGVTSTMNNSLTVAGPAGLALVKITPTSPNKIVAANADVIYHLNSTGYWSKAISHAGVDITAHLTDDTREMFPQENALTVLSGNDVITPVTYNYNSSTEVISSSPAVAGYRAPTDLASVQQLLAKDYPTSINIPNGTIASGSNFTDNVTGQYITVGSDLVLSGNSIIDLGARTDNAPILVSGGVTLKNNGGTPNQISQNANSTVIIYFTGTVDIENGFSNPDTSIYLIGVGSNNEVYVNNANFTSSPLKAHIYTNKFSLASSVTSFLFEGAITCNNSVNCSQSNFNSTKGITYYDDSNSLKPFFENFLPLASQKTVYYISQYTNN